MTQRDLPGFLVDLFDFAIGQFRRCRSLMASMRRMGIVRTVPAMRALLGSRDGGCCAQGDSDCQF